MELWIRTQDKECLMKIDRVDYDLSNREHRIVVNGFKTIVGIYETKKRALEVLDEINERIMMINVFNQVCDEKYANSFNEVFGNRAAGIAYPYQMPQE